MPTPPQIGSHRRLAAGVVAICFTLGLASRGTFETFTVFLLPLAEAFDAPRSELTGIYATGFLAAGLGSPLAGLVFDRFGPGRLYPLGVVLAALSLLGLSFATALWQFYVGWGLVLGLAGAMMGNVAHSALLGRWFTTRLGTMISLVFSAMGVGVLLLVPLTQVLIELDGWRFALRALAALFALVLLPLVLAAPWRRIMAGHPDYAAAGFAGAAEDFRDWTLNSAIRSVAFWGLVWVFFGTGAGIYAVTVQLVAYLVEIGFPPLMAASAFGLTGILTPVGMLGFGWLSDRIGRRPAVGLSYGVTVAAFLGFLGLAPWPSDWLLGFAMICLGLSLGSRGPVISAIASRLFQGPAFGRIYGVILMGGGTGGAAGALIGGLMHDWTGGTQAVLYFGLAMVIAGSLPFWLVPAYARH